MSDFRIVCTDTVRGTVGHPSRELALLDWRGEQDPERFWADAVGDVSPESRLQAPDSIGFVESRSARRGGQVVVSEVVERGSKHPEGTLWRFRCPCGRDLPLRDLRLRKAIAGLVAAGVSRLDISHLR